MSDSSSIHLLSRHEGKRVVAPFLTIFKAVGEETGGAFALVEHVIMPQTLAAPPHLHRNEDEYTYLIEGELGIEIGEETVQLIPGMFVTKPRGIMHTFWNPGDRPARLLEIIAPAGFEQYFEELDACFRSDGPPDMDGITAVARKYQLEFAMERVPELLAKYGVRMPGM